MAVSLVREIGAALRRCKKKLTKAGKSLEKATSQVDFLSKDEQNLQQEYHRLLLRACPEIYAKVEQLRLAVCEFVRQKNLLDSYCSQVSDNSSAEVMSNRLGDLKQSIAGADSVIAQLCTLFNGRRGFRDFVLSYQTVRDQMLDHIERADMKQNIWFVHGGIANRADALLARLQAVLTSAYAEAERKGLRTKS